jgi:acetolactate synthase-1/2/3 large subunit
MTKDTKDTVPVAGRRKFFGTVAAGAAGAVGAVGVLTVVSPESASAASEASSGQAQPVVALPDAATATRETAPPPPELITVGKTGSDFMVDVIKTLDVKYVGVMPGDTFRALHESIIDYGNNVKPELLSCLHEEVAVSMAHGYAKASGKPMMAIVHSVVGLQHASMSIYNAWADRVPVLVVCGNPLDVNSRVSTVDWDHAAQDNAALVRDFTKWDDQPVSLDGFSDSMVRAYELATTPPCAPTLIVAASGIAESPISDTPRPIPALNVVSPPVGDPVAVAAAAKLLVEAQNPVLVAGRLARTQRGVQMLVELAEMLGAPVIDQMDRMNMPSQHPLNLTWQGRSLIAEADVICGLEVVDMWGTVNSYLDRVAFETEPVASPSAKVISIDSSTLLLRSNYQDFERYQPVDLAIAGDGEETLPLLLEAVRQALPKGGATVAARTEMLRQRWVAMHRQLRLDASYGWDASPISVPRMCQDLYAQIKDDDWALVTPHQFQMHWQIKLWNFTKHYQHIGDAGGYGVGYQPGAAVGAAIAHRDAGNRLAIAIVGDGDLMCNPGALWTAAHHRVPLLILVHNNRAYHQEHMHVQRMADRHARGISRAYIGTTMRDPFIDYGKLAQSMGVWGEGPVSDPAELAPAIRRALDVVRQGQPALIDVVSQPR